MTLNSAQVRKTLRRNKKRVIRRARRTYAALRAPGGQAVPAAVAPPPKPVTQAPAESKAASPPVPQWLQEARQHGRERRWDSAIAAYERGLAETPDDPALLQTLGQLHLKRHHLDDAAKYLRAALDRDPESSEAYFMLAATLIRLDDRPGAEACLAAGAHSMPGLPENAYEMALDNGLWFPHRLKALDWVGRNLDAIRAGTAAPGPAPVATGEPGPVFMYWAQGFENAPPVVRMCRDRLLDAAGGRSVVLLDEALLPFYVEIPPHVTAALKKHRTQHSDLVRLVLLERYGGVWFDATCLVTRPLDDWLPELEVGDFFAFNRSGTFISSWFLTARPYSPLVAMMRSALYLYWEQHDRLWHGFIFHEIFEALYYRDEAFRQSWDATQKRCSGPPHMLGNALRRQFDETVLRDACAESAVHKLSRKCPPDCLALDSVLSVLIRRHAGVGGHFRVE